MFKVEYMNNIKATLITLLLLEFSTVAYSAACDSSAIPEPLYKLIEYSKYDKAVEQAKAEYKKQSGNKESSLILAKVYVNATLHAGMSFDLSKLGFKKGEKGKKKITKEQLKAATRGALVVNKKYLEETDAFIQQTVKKWPESKGLFYCLTKVHFYNHDHARFIKLLDQTANAHKDSENEAVDFLITYGTKFIKTHRYDLASEVYETLLKTFPHAAPALSTLGVTYIKRGFTKKAMDYFEQAYKFAPDDTIVISNIAEAAMLLADFNKAGKFLKLKAKHNPNKVDIYFDLAINAMHADPEQSKPYWKKYFEVNAKYPDSKSWSDNAKVIQAAVKDGTYDEYDWFYLGTQMINQRVPKYAVALMTNANNKHPYDASISYGLAHAYDNGKHFDLAEKALLETLIRMKHPKNKFTTDTNEIYFNLSRCSLSLDREEDTEAYLKKVKQDSKYAANADYMFGLIQHRRGNKQKAQNYFKSCIKKAKDNPYKQYCESQLTMGIKTK